VQGESQWEFAKQVTVRKRKEEGSTSLALSTLAAYFEIMRTELPQQENRLWLNAYYKAQLLDAIPYLESGRPSRALCVL
jgi:hypothetical protein